MAQDYKIVAVSQEPPRTWESKYGPMETYRVKLEGREDVPTEVNRKPGNAPKAGDVLYGDIQRTEYGDKFKAASKPFGQAGGGSSPKQPRDDSAIYAQWALGRAYEKHGAVDKAVVDAKWLVEQMYQLKEYKPGEKEQARDWTSLGKPKDVVAAVTGDESDAELKGLMEQGVFEDEPINLDDIDIPF